MENVIKLNKCLIDFKKLTEEDFKKNDIKIKIYSCVNDLFAFNSQNMQMDYGETIFNMHIEIGEEKTIMTGIPIDTLELYATSILTHIKLIRQTYHEQIKMQTDMGSII